MSDFFLFDSELCVRWVISLMHFLWQGAAIGLLTLLVIAVHPNSSARFRANLYFLSLIAMPMCLLVTYAWLDPSLSKEFPWEWVIPVVENTPDADEAHATLNGGSAGFAAPSLRNLAPILFISYLIGVFSMLGHLLMRVFGTVRLNRRSTPADDPALLLMIREAAQCLKLRYQPRVAYCREIAVPSLVGVLKPIILLPFAFGSGLSPRQIEMVILHELAHLRRWDHLIQPVQLCIEAFLFFHPAVWLISNRLRVVREHCCDDLVLASGGSRKEYASVLVQLAEKGRFARRQTPFRGVAVSIIGSLPHSALTDRIVRMFEEPAPNRLRFHFSSTLSVYLTVAVVAGGVILQRWSASRAESDNFHIAGTGFQDEGWLDRSPFSGVRWEGETPWVNIEGGWYELESVDGVPAERLVEACKHEWKTRYPDSPQEGYWRRSGLFQHNLLRYLADLGRFPAERVDVAIRRDGSAHTLEDAPMTLEKFKQNLLSICPLRDPERMVDFAYPRRAPYSAIDWDGSVPIVEVEGRFYKLLSINDIPVSEILDFCQKTYGDSWRMRFEEDLVGVLSQMGEEAFALVKLDLVDLDGERISIPNAPMTKSNRDAIAWMNDIRLGRE